MDRRLFIVIAVLGFHVLGLWALQTGLLRRAVELVVPVTVLAEMIEPPQTLATPAPPQPKPTLAQKTLAHPHPVAQPAPHPVAIIDPTPAPQTPTGIIEPQPPAPAASTEAAPAPPALPVESPSSSAYYLNNPKPAYPRLSKTLNEKGEVIVRAYIEVNGIASKAEILTSSGYDRLDQAALHTVKNRWRFMPSKRDGVPFASWVEAPVRFELDE